MSGISQMEIRQIISFKAIKKAARKHKSGWHFNRRYSDKETNHAFHQDCSNRDTFNIYLDELYKKTKDDLYIFVTDISSTIYIKIITENDTFRYEGKFPNPFRQPWYDLESTISEQAAYSNLEINFALHKLLPKNFINRNTISQEALIRDYIYWFLKRREVII